MHAIQVKATLTLDDDSILDDDVAKRWFMDRVIYGDDLVVHCNGEVGDIIGRLKIHKFKDAGTRAVNLLAGVALCGGAAGVALAVTGEPVLGGAMLLCVAAYGGMVHFTKRFI